MNRAYFLEELKRLEFSRLYPITIMLADLEDLNKINYQYDMSSGDELVKHTATLLRTVFRSEDMVARISGDEFIALMPRCSACAAEKALQRVVNMVEGVQYGTTHLTPQPIFGNRHRRNGPIVGGYAQTG